MTASAPRRWRRSGVDDQLEDDRLAAARPRRRCWWPSSRRPASRAAQPSSPPTSAISQRFEQERDEDLPAGVAQQPQHADVLGPLADGGEHRVHHAEDAADRHHDRDEADGAGELLVRFGEALVVFGFDLGADGRLLVVLRRGTLQNSAAVGVVGRAEDQRRVGVFAEQRGRPATAWPRSRN